MMLEIMLSKPVDDAEAVPVEVGGNVVAEPVPTFPVPVGAPVPVLVPVPVPVADGSSPLRMDEIMPPDGPKVL